MFGKLLSACAVAVIGLAVTPAVQAQSVAGAYLAGRHAAVRSDYREAAHYYTQALARDINNPELMESSALAYLSLGQIDKALPLARRMEEKGQKSQVAHLVMTAGLAKADDFAGLLARDQDTGGGIGPWVDGLVKAWAQLGAGDVEVAMGQFDALAQEPGIQGFVGYHKALALGSIGDFETAESIFASDGAGAAGQTRRGVIAHATVLSQLGKNEDAVVLLRTSFEGSTDPELDELIVALEAGETIPFDQVRNAREGIAEVFFTFAAVLKSEAAGDYYVLLYSRIARYLKPDHIDALLLSAGLLEALGQQELAIAEFKDVPADNPAYHVAELGRAGALRRSDRLDQAIEVLEQLTRSHGDLPVVHSTLGDMLRGKEQYGEAIEAYNKAVDLASEDNRARWVLLYSRGIAYERTGDEVSAERDFRAALEINPEQPQVLNYLGYSLVEQQRNLEEALDMIERAVAASPDSGYIVDSLGWVLYRMGRYEQAVVQMERAVSLLATDPVVNDHLGDVYWAVGREREAEFQWRRALSFVGTGSTAEEADAERIRRKLDVGLDVVLEEEGAAPLRDTENDN